MTVKQKKQIIFVWALVLFIVLAVGANIAAVANSPTVWLFVLALVGHGIDTVKRLGRPDKYFE